MAIQVNLDDHTGNVSHQAKIDENALVAQLIPAIITSLRLPITDNTGRSVTYHLSHHGRLLQEDETLTSAEVQPGDSLTVVPEFTAGGEKLLPNEFISNLLLERFMTLEKGAETSSEQLKRVEKTLNDLQVALRKIQMTIGEALIGSSIGEENRVVEVVNSQFTNPQELLTQANEAAKQYSYPTLPTHLEKELRNILATSREKKSEPDEVSSLSTFHIRIVDEPLTVQNLSTIFTSLNTLYTKCLLIAKGQLDNLVEYAQTHTDRFALEANFFITDITHNSPFNFDISLNPESVAKAMQLAIDSVSLRELRKKEQELVLQAKELDMKLKEQEAQSKVTNDKHLHQREVQEAELDRQKRLLEIEKQQLELEKQRFEFYTMRISYSLETAKRMVDLLHQGKDEATKAMIVQTLLPDLLQIGSSRGLQLILSDPQEELESKNS